MSFYKYAKEHYDQPKENLGEVYSERIQKWRREPKMVKQENPTRIPKARQLGYKSKQGFNIIRVQVDKGGTKRARVDAGRAPSKTGQSRYSPKKSKQVIAEERVSSKYENLEVLNSYWAAEDGNRKWFEVIMVDPDHPEIQTDDDINWICNNRNRAENGQTPAQKKTRGLQNKGKGSEKMRPSQNANDGKGK